MAVANVYQLKDWDEWRKEMEEKRRNRWREKVRRWMYAHVSDEEDESEDVEEDEEAEDLKSKEEVANVEGEQEKKGNGEDEETAGAGSSCEKTFREDGGRFKRDKSEDVEEEEEEVDVNEREEVRESYLNRRDQENAFVVDEEVDGGLSDDENNEELRESGEDWRDEGEEFEDDVEEVENNNLVDEAEEHRDDQMETLEEGQHQGEDDIEAYQEQPEGHPHGEELEEQVRSLQVENNHQRQESAREDNWKSEEEDYTSDSEESTGSEDSKSNSSENQGTEKQVEDTAFKDVPDKETQRSEDVLEAGTAEKDEKHKSTDNDEIQLWVSQIDFQDEEDKQDDTVDLKEDEWCVEDEDYDEVKIYHKDNYPAYIFHSLRHLRESSLLTDLTLQTEDGKSFHVHSPVLAAVSSLIPKNLIRAKAESCRTNEKIQIDLSAGVRVWSVSFGPEVDYVGIEAIVEFAYNGVISCLNKQNLEQIKVAAEALGVPRVLDLCIKEEIRLVQSGANKKKEKISTSQQLMITFQSIKQMWMNRVGCDVTLETPDGSLHAHRSILAASSDYFRGMFTSGMRESRKSHIDLPFLSISELEPLVESSYNGELNLSWMCIFELTIAALQLQYQPALSLCLNFLQQEINPHTCLDVVSFAEAYEIIHLLELADDFVLRQFQKVVATSKFKYLPAKQLFKYLNSHSLCVPSELVVFNAVVGWIQANPRKRLRLTKDLMKTVHFPLMTFMEFKEVQSQNMWADPSLTDLYETIFEDFCSNETAPENQCRIYLPKESLILTGGNQISDDLGSRTISRDLWFGNSLRNHTGIKKAMEWRRLGEMPGPQRFSHEVAVLDGQLYIFGGKQYYGIGDTLNSVYRFDPLQNSWECLSEMLEKRCSFSVVILDGKFYAIGGHCEPDHIDTVECYCPSANSWSFTCPLDLPLCGHVAKVLHGQIFISGGENRDYLCLASMILYHPETGSAYLSNMRRPRTNHCMEILGECLYVAGGTTTYDYEAITDQLACEMYDPAADCWTAFASLPVPHVGAGSAVLEEKFYVLGGYSQEDYSDIKMVHRYDATTEKWENMGKMPGPNNDLRASVLHLPQHFRL